MTDLSDPRDNDSVTQLRIPAQHKNANSIKRAKQCETLVHTDAIDNIKRKEVIFRPSDLEASLSCWQGKKKKMTRKSKI